MVGLIAPFEHDHREIVGVGVRASESALIGENGCQYIGSGSLS